LNLRQYPLFFRTLINLRFIQIFYRIWYGVRPQALTHLRSDPQRTSYNVDWTALKPNAPFITYNWLVANEIARGRFLFLQKTADDSDKINWQAPGKGRLWRYNLHYFQYLFPHGGLASNIGLSLIRNWMDHNPFGTRDAWDPFPVSLRLVNWIKYLSVIPASDTDLRPIVRSAYMQTSWLERSIEYHLLGNHLFKNAKALLFAGLFFKSNDAQRWLSKGLRLLHHEIEEQILPDGGHFERSPMYHTMILEDCLDLLNVCQVLPNRALQKFSELLLTTAHNMINFIVALTHPDGNIALFNDSAFGIESPPSDLVSYYKNVTKENVPDLKNFDKSFAVTGYFIMTPRPCDRLLVDCGPIGPKYQSGHAHCDTLSFELSLKGRRVIVDSGCYHYEKSSMRQYNRGNAGHNTLTIDKQNQSEIWDVHRCARRARPLYAKLKTHSTGTIHFEGAHDGYHRLPGSPTHHRRIVWSGQICRIEDKVEGKGLHEIESRLHIHPSLSVVFKENEVSIQSDHEELLKISLGQGGCIQRREGWYCPEFGIKMRCPVLLTTHKSVSLPFKEVWILKISK